MEFIIMLIGVLFALGVIARSWWVDRAPIPPQVTDELVESDTAAPPQQLPTPDSALPTDPLQEHFDATRPDPARSSDVDDARHALARARATREAAK